MCPSFDEIETLIRVELDALANDQASQKYKDTDWTLELKSRLAWVGQHLGYEVRTSARESSEWLYDMCWLETRDGFVTSAELVLESEWKQSAAEYDFDKLLLARAKHRVMVFTALKREGPGGSIERLIHRVRQFGHSALGDRYLFAAWVNSEWAFDYRLHVVEGAPSTIKRYA